jgi:uncharacterized membrane protein YidH (DUF202 family)
MGRKGGATVFHGWKLLCTDFVVLIFISLIIASPVAYYGIYKWLNNYSYRTGIEWWVFAAAGLVLVLISLMTVSFQAIKTALASPVSSLRT